MPKRKQSAAAENEETQEDGQEEEEEEEEEEEDEEGKGTQQEEDISTSTNGHDTADSSNKKLKHNTASMTNISIPFNDSKHITCALYACELQPTSSHDSPLPPPNLIFTHGAGGGITAPATSDLASGFSSSAAALPIICFQGSLNLTNRVKYFNAVIDHFYQSGEDGRDRSKTPFALGGRSMGARAAVLTALVRNGNQNQPDEDDEVRIKELVLVSYPILTGNAEREPSRREEILLDLSEDMDVLFISGADDTQMDWDVLQDVRKGMKARSWLCVVEGADHGMGLKGKKGKDGEAEMRRMTGMVAAKWLRDKRTEGKGRRLRMGWDKEMEEVFVGEWESVHEGKSVG